MAKFVSFFFGASGIFSFSHSPSSWGSPKMGRWQLSAKFSSFSLEGHVKNFAHFSFLSPILGTNLDRPIHLTPLCRKPQPGPQVPIADQGRPAQGSTLSVGSPPLKLGGEVPDRPGCFRDPPKRECFFALNVPKVSALANFGAIFFGASGRDKNQSPGPPLFRRGKCPPSVGGMTPPALTSNPDPGLTEPRT